VTRDDRPLEERLTDYRDSLAFMPPQLQDIIDRMPADADTTPIGDAIRFYSEVANDLTKILNGEELKRFRIEGQLPG